MTIQDLAPFMFSAERMEFLLKAEIQTVTINIQGALEKTQSSSNVIMPRSMLPPPPVGQPMEPIKEKEKEKEEEKEKEQEQIYESINYNEVKYVIKESNSISKDSSSSSSSSSNIFFPKEKDKLFWCFYIMKNGLEEYKELGQTNIVIEKKIKIEYIELLRTRKALLKAHKMAPLSHVENALLNEFRIDMKTFLALCVCENLPMIYIHKSTYYELCLDDEMGDSEEQNIHTITQFDEPLKHGYSFGNKDNVKNLYKIDNLNKPLKALSAYKLDELLDMCHKLGHKMVDKKETKQQLYEYIVQIMGV